ncbi:MAG: T9SS C-terminal target domain-containing protein [Bacteroidetes bacterium]|nr:MAG: T9SS C-terminal target domain-containing protein [Bacteroidota bacterium]REK05224.1 MAG: T9SS C-terminal target domain-containing protein [Bacteroidota bacterium]REK32629.1 MAG: T9SS C-terminal target domain-containing protein [Bacteroidota bacterium]REK48924.1 MAG: T9SS C-terminal target domain-containing protein [Bacteroidota bacterium]
MKHNNQMKHKIITLLFAFICIGSIFRTNAQTELWSTSKEGGSYNLGVIFKIKPDGSGFDKVYEFDGTIGSLPLGSLTLSSNGLLYGQTTSGGTFNNGVIFSLDPKTFDITKLHDFNGNDGAWPTGNLFESPDGKLYGMTSSGGLYNNGVMFYYEPSSSQFVKLLDFDYFIYGSNPVGSLMMASNGNIYGMTSEGGGYWYQVTNNDGTSSWNFKEEFGVLFSYNSTLNAFYIEHIFIEGGNPTGTLVEASDGKIYGVTETGGWMNGGEVFSYDPITNLFESKHEFSLWIDGQTPVGSLTELPSGILFGMTMEAGGYSKGIIFSYNPVSETFQKEFDFDGTSSGSYPKGSLVTTSNGMLYGMTSEGGTLNNGVLFQFDPLNSNYTKLRDLNDLEGKNPGNGDFEILPEILSTSVASTKICSGKTISVNYSTNGRFNVGNIFSVQLSDSAGSFENALTIGSNLSIHPGTINVTIPGGVAPSNFYRFRVVSSSPAVIGNKTENNISINTFTSSIALHTPVLCFGENAIVQVSGVGGLEPYNGTGIISLAAGNHQLTITDANGCNATGEITILQPDKLTSSLTLIEPIKCYGGTANIRIDAQGGTSPINGIRNYQVSSGTHNFVITDANGCISEESISLSEPDLLTATHRLISPILCFGGTAEIEISAQGGLAPYTGTGLSQLQAGNHSLSIMDANGCTYISSVNILQPAALSISTQITNEIRCNGEMAEIHISANGGTPPYSNIGNLSLPAGLHHFTVSDANNCITTASLNVNQPAELAAIVSYNPIACHGGTTNVQIQLSGGTGPYVESSHYTLPTGNYSYVLSDSKGCSTTATFSLSQPAPLNLNLGSDRYALFGALGFTGCINLQPNLSGGAGGYSYLWQSTHTPANGFNGPILSVCNTSETQINYSLTVSDALGCSISSQVKVDYINIDCSKNQNSTKVKVCHVSPGNPRSCQSVCVSTNAVNTLLNNGSYLGQCLPSCATPVYARTSSEPIIAESTIDIYPNPSKSKFIVKFADPSISLTQITISDSFGRIIHIDNEANGYEFEREYDLGKFEAGIYAVKFHADDECIKTLKLIKAE